MFESLRVLVVPDKFKGTLSAAEAAAAIARGWRHSRPRDQLTELPMADGGEGFGEVFSGLLGGQVEYCSTVDAAGRARTACWWYAASSRTAIVEAAQVNGLQLLRGTTLGPLERDTFGLGAVLRNCARYPIEQLYVGIGGSGTNDGGFGLALALGWKFMGENGGQIGRFTELTALERIEAPAEALAFDELVVAVDVDNPLLGARGATYTYGPQKGLTAGELALAEACLTRLAAVVHRHAGHDISAEPGSGAAGGLGFGLRAFAGAALRSGASMFAALSDLGSQIDSSDVVVTGEGSLDEQSLMGKGVGLVLRFAAQRSKPALCLAGSISLTAAALAAARVQARAIVPELGTIGQAKASPSRYLEQLAARVAREWRAP